MHHSCVVGVRIASSAAAVAGFVLIQFAASTSTYADSAMVAVDATPTPVTTVFATPTPIGQAAPVGSSTSPSQQASDSIAAVSQQVAQTAHDPSLPIDAKVQRINALATQFNQLVAQWQQQLPPGAQAVNVSTVPPTVPVATPQPTPQVASAVPTSADQLRAQIATVSQQITRVAQDPTLSGDAKTTQLTALETQFNQLITQLQQLGG